MAAGIKGNGDDSGTFGDKDAVGRVEAVAELGLGQAAVGGERDTVDVVDFDNHTIG